MVSSGGEGELVEACRELGVESPPAAACFIFCHGAFSAALRLSVIYRLTAATPQQRGSVCVKLTLLEIYENL